MKALPLALLLAALVGSAGAQTEVPGLVRQLAGGSDEARLKLIDLGLPEVPALVQVMATQTGRPVAEAERTIGWIVERAAQSPLSREKATWTLVNLLLDPEQPLAVRRMAAGLLGRVADGKVVPTLAPLLGQRDLRDAALWSLQRLPGQAARDALAAASRSAAPEFHAAILEALAQRPDRPVSLFVEAADNRSTVVRLAALHALAQAADPATAPFLAARARSAASDERTAALKAYLAVGEGLLARGDRSTAGELFREALPLAGEDTPAIAAALTGLGRAAVPGSSRLVAPFLRSLDPAVLVAATGALAHHPDRNATQLLVAALPGATAPAATAILTALADRADASAIPAILPAVQAASPGVRLAAVRALARAPSAASLPVVQPFLRAGGAVGAAAVDVTLADAGVLAARGQKREAIDAYLKVLDVLSDDPRATAILTRLGALGAPVDLGSRHGFITCWRVIGPFPSPNKSGYDRVFFPEQELNFGKEYDFDGRKLRWRFVHTADPNGIVDYVPLFTPNENVVCYAQAEVTVPQAEDIRVKSGSDDGIVLWVNGERLFGTNADRSLEVDKDSTDARLRAGRNTILIKVIQGAVAWNACVRLTDRTDQPLRFEQRGE